MGIGFRHKVYQRKKLVCNGLVVLQPVAVAGHVNDLAVVDEPVEYGGGDGGVAKEVGPLIKAFVGSNNEGSSLAHSGDEAKEQISLGRGKWHEAHLVHHHEGGFVEVLETALAGTGDFSGLD